jgi:hypothetical protein
MLAKLSDVRSSRVTQSRRQCQRAMRGGDRSCQYGAIYDYNSINEGFSRLVSQTVASPEWDR